VGKAEVDPLSTGFMFLEIRSSKQGWIDLFVRELLDYKIKVLVDISLLKMLADALLSITGPLLGKSPTVIQDKGTQICKCHHTHCH